MMLRSGCWALVPLLAVAALLLPRHLEAVVVREVERVEAPPILTSGAVTCGAWPRLLTLSGGEIWEHREGLWSVLPGVGEKPEIAPHSAAWLTSSGLFVHSHVRMHRYMKSHWTAVHSTPHPPALSLAATFTLSPNHVAFHGGRAAWGVSNMVWVFSVTDGRWLPGATSPVSLAGHAAVADQSTLYLVGAEGVVHRLAFTFENTTFTVTSSSTLPPLPQPVTTQLAAALLDQQLWVVAVREGIFSYNGTEWATHGKSILQATVPPGRNVAMVPVNTTTAVTLLIPNNTAVPPLAHVAYLSNGSLSISTPPASPPPVAYPTLVTLGTSLILFGGVQGARVYNTLWAFHTEGWTQVFPTSEPPGGVYGHTAVVYGGSIMVVFGGSNGLSMTNELWLLRTSSLAMVWRQETPNGPSPAPRALHAAAIQNTPDGGVMWLYGGVDSRGATLSDLWRYTFSSARWDLVEERAEPGALALHTVCIADSRLVVSSHGRMWHRIVGGDGGWYKDTIRHVRLGHHMQCAGQQILILGGISPGGIVVPYSESFRFREGKLVADEKEEVVRVSHGSAAAVIGDRLVVAGGFGLLPSQAPTEWPRGTTVTWKLFDWPCSEGTYTNTTSNASSCDTCPAGTFSNRQGAASCTACPAGTFGWKKGSVACDMCPTSTFNDMAGRDTCTQCPEDSLCPVGTVRPLPLDDVRDVQAKHHRGFNQERWSQEVVYVFISWVVFTVVVLVVCGAVYCLNKSARMAALDLIYKDRNASRDGYFIASVQTPLGGMAAVLWLVSVGHVVFTAFFYMTYYSEVEYSSLLVGMNREWPLDLTVSIEMDYFPGQCTYDGAPRGICHEAINVTLQGLSSSTAGSNYLCRQDSSACFVEFYCTHCTVHRQSPVLDLTVTGESASASELEVVVTTTEGKISTVLRPSRGVFRGLKEQSEVTAVLYPVLRLVEAGAMADSNAMSETAEVGMDVGLLGMKGGSEVHGDADTMLSVGFSLRVTFQLDTTVMVYRTYSRQALGLYLAFFFLIVGGCYVIWGLVVRGLVHCFFPMGMLPAHRVGYGKALQMHLSGLVEHVRAYDSASGHLLGKLLRVRSQPAPSAASEAHDGAPRAADVASEATETESIPPSTSRNADLASSAELTCKPFLRNDTAMDSAELHLVDHEQAMHYEMARKVRGQSHFKGPRKDMASAMLDGRMSQPVRDALGTAAEAVDAFTVSHAEARQP
eukprot:Sspe_Gene.59813::Locus_32888_Transcript_1_1_Confidence_1.000_Length_3683::g.59813::m.59813